MLTTACRRALLPLLFLAMLFPVATLAAAPAKRGAAAVPAKRGAAAAVPVDLVSPQEVKALVDIGADPVLVDTQDEEAYRKMHITGSVNVPWAERIRKPADLPRNRILVLYCDCDDESESTDVARQLIRDWGYSEVKVLRSGLGGWICQNYPVEGDASERTSCQ